MRVRGRMQVTLVRFVAVEGVNLGSLGVGGVGMTQVKGRRTSKSHGVPASAVSTAFAAFVAYLLLCSKWIY